MTDRASPDRPIPPWVTEGRGLGPHLRWSAISDGPLTALVLCRETGEIVFADEARELCRLDRQGKITALTRLRQPLRKLVWSDDGESGFGLTGPRTLLHFDRKFAVKWKLSLPEECITIATEPFGQYVASSLVDGGNLIHDIHRRRVSGFTTIRPLAHTRLLAEAAYLVGAAEHGLLCCFSLSGEMDWQEKVWSNVGSLATTGDGEFTYLAAYGHGIQVFDGEGGGAGSFVFEGAIRQIDVSDEAGRLVATTLERHLYWLDSEGEMLWGTVTPDDVHTIICEPLGEGIYVALPGGEIYCFDWSGG